MINAGGELILMVNHLLLFALDFPSTKAKSPKPAGCYVNPSEGVDIPTTCINDGGGYGQQQWATV